MPHSNLEGTPTARELELAHGLVTGELLVWILVCVSEEAGNTLFRECLGLLGEFSWFQKVKRPYRDALVDVYALPVYATNWPDDNHIGSYTYGERSGRLVVCLSERTLHKRIHYLARQWDQVLLDDEVAEMGFCPECARLCPSQSLDGDRFPAECHPLVDGECPACGWT